MKADDQQDYYRELWRSRGSRLSGDERERMARILRAVRRESGSDSAKAILDLGCGTGWLGPALCRFGSVTCADFDRETIHSAAAAAPPAVGFRVLLQDEPRFGLPEQSFDVVVSSEVIEHVVDQDGFMKMVRDLLRPGGLAVFTTPRGELFELWRSQPGIAPQPVENWLTGQSLQALAERHGFSVREHRPFYYLPLSASPLDRMLRTTLARKALGIAPLHRLLDSRGIYQLLAAVKR